MTAGGSTLASGMLPGAAGTLHQAGSENFPVALHLLPRRIRSDLMAIYGFARYVDDLGDELEGGPQARLVALDAAECELDCALEGRAEHPIFVHLSSVISRHHLGPSLFRDLIEANRRDQRVTAYASYEDLLDYCRLSANPVGRLVLGLAGAATPQACRLSDDVCTGLQLVEHIQDIREDAGNGRVYLPAEDMDRFGVRPGDLGVSPGDLGVSPGDLGASGRTPAALRRLVAFELARARRLLSSGAELSGQLKGFFSLAIAGYGGGGIAQAKAIERAGYDVLPRLVKAPRRAVLAESLRLYRRGHPPRRRASA